LEEDRERDKRGVEGGQKRSKRGVGRGGRDREHFLEKW
jgi:hypothetical protein